MDSIIGTMTLGLVVLMDMETGIGQEEIGT